MPEPAEADMARSQSATESELVSYIDKAVLGGTIADEGRARMVQSIHVPQPSGLVQEA